MADVKGGVNLLNGVQISTSLSAIATISTTIDRFQIGQATVVNSGSVPRAINIYILQEGEVATADKKARVDLNLSVGESYLLYEIMGMSINAGGEIQAIVDGGTDVAMFVNGTEFGKA